MNKNKNITHINNTTKIIKKQKKHQQKIIINWYNYSIALGNRGDFLVFLDQAIELGAFNEIPPAHKKGCPTKYSDALITLMLIYRILYHQPLRQVVNFTRSALLCRGIVVALPNYSTLCRRASKLKVDILPIDYFQTAPNELCFMLDSSGFKIDSGNEWFCTKWNKSAKHLWLESHVAVNYNDRMILSIINTERYVHDNTQLLPSLISAERNLTKAGVIQKLATIIGDGAYDSHDNYILAKNLGTRLIVPPPVNATLHMHKDKSKNKFVDDVGWEDRNGVVRAIKYRGGLDKWKEEVGYHRRSLNENVFFRLKTIFGEKMMSKTKKNCEVEQALKAKILNIFTTFGLPKYETR